MILWISYEDSSDLGASNIGIVLSVGCQKNVFSIEKREFLCSYFLKDQ